MDEPRPWTGPRGLGLGVLAVAVAAVMAGSSYRGETSQEVSALCIAIGGAALILAGGILMAVERRNA